MKRKLLYTSILVLMSFISFSQQMNNTLYYLNYSTQANYLNPAMNPDSKLWIGIPGLSSLSMNYNSNSFTLGNLLVKKDGIKPVKIDINGLYGAMRDKSRASIDTDISLLTAGMRFDDHLVTFDIRHKTSAEIGASKDIVGFFNNGTVAYLGQSLNFGGTQANFLSYNEIAIGYSRSMDNLFDIILGAKVKFLFGIASLDMTDANVNMDIAADGMSANVRANSSVRIAGPVKFNNLPGAKFKIADMEFDDNAGASSFIGTENLGFAVDLGAEYKLDEKITLSASLLDLGIINWSNGHTLKMNADYLWSGIDVNKQIKDNNVDSFKEFTDDLENEFEITSSDGSYIEFLPTKLYLGATYKVYEWLDAGLLSRTQLYNNRVHTALTASGNVKYLQRYSASLSYSFTNYSYANIGFGFTAQAGPVQLFMVTDNLLGIDLANTKLMNLRMGLTLRFGLDDRVRRSRIYF